MTSCKSVSAGLLVLAAATCGAARADEGEWRPTLVVYAMGAALDGDATVGTVTVPVDLSASDVIDALEFGAMAALRLDNGTWSVTGDFTYMGLGATAHGQRQGLVKGEVDVDQTTFMVTVGRRLTPALEALFSLGYVDLSTDLHVTTTGPDGLVDTQAHAGADWIDPLLGLQYNVPFADDWRFNLRGDVGGFGIGSDMTYQLLTNVRWQANERTGVAFGYRFLSFDYEDGDQGAHSYQHYDLVEQGPFVGLTIDF